MVDKLKSLDLSSKVFLLLVLISIIWELFFFVNFIKSAFVDGLVIAWFISQGLVPYRDFFVHYFPLFYMMMAVFHKVFGFTQTPTILLAPITSTMLIGVVSIFSWKWIRGWYRIIPLLFIVLWLSALDENQFGTNSYLNVLTALIFISWWAWYRYPRKWLAASFGVLAGFSLMSSQITIFFISLVYVSVIYRVLRERKHVGSLILASGAFCIPVLILIFYLASNGVLQLFYNFNISYFISGSGYPYAAGGKTIRDVIVYVAVFSPTILAANVFYKHLRKGRLSKKNSYQLSQYFFWLLMLISFPVPFWFAMFHPSRFTISVTVYALTLGLALEGLLRKGGKTKLIPIACLLLVAAFNLAAVWVYALPEMQRGFATPAQYKVLSKLTENDPMFYTAKWIRENTPPDAKLFATTEFLIYFESKRLLINKRATTNLPFAYRPITQLKSELLVRPPDYWVIDERQWARIDDFGYPEATIFLKKVLDCEPVVQKFEYITIRKHTPGQELCL